MKKLWKSLFVFFISAIILVPLTVCAAGLGKWQYPKKIRTYIPPNHKRTEMMKHAFQRWTRVTNQRIIFVYVSDKKNAQLEVEFVNVIPNADREIGLTQSRVTAGNHILRSKVSIAEKTSNMQSLSEDAVFTVMLHEIGHAIGLEHTKEPLSIMYPMEDDRQEIQKSDLKRLAEIYGW
ncbi:matrixin family metalloprotease [bacterium]|nr:matrixin family metalloprotease [bacterium]